MNNVNKSEQSFIWKYFDNATFYFQQHKPSKLFRDENYIVKINLIEDSGWDKQDFLDAIEVWKSFNYGGEDLMCLNDLEENIDKYLNLITIKTIIK